jgi:hypothetical protein
MLPALFRFTAFAFAWLIALLCLWPLIRALDIKRGYDLDTAGNVAFCFIEK